MKNRKAGTVRLGKWIGLLNRMILVREERSQVEVTIGLILRQTNLRGLRARGTKGGKAFPHKLHSFNEESLNLFTI